MNGRAGKSGSSASPSIPRSQMWSTSGRRFATQVGVLSPSPSNTLIPPGFSATKMRPSGAKRTAVGASRPLKAVVSWKPGSNPGDPVLSVRSLPQPELEAFEAQTL